jgi:putative addiction module component (TIGR02574 family)
MIETTWKSLGLEHLPTSDKILIVEKLWEDLGKEAESAPVPSSHADEIRHRIAESSGRPDEGSSWEELKAEIENEL